MNANHGKAFTYALLAIWVAQLTLSDLHTHYPDIKQLSGAALVVGALWRAIYYVLTAKSVQQA